MRKEAEEKAAKMKLALSGAGMTVSKQQQTLPKKTSGSNAMDKNGKYAATLDDSIDSDDDMLDDLLGDDSIDSDDD
eukprot:CAMPEP_0202453220 /NCGR_PEP_ID=MMETSP1360-20130828/11236_1 /ASSEMBLY_ACC=CAM_ASM_000848 /TAXON_ID=515479 /ORGANISM="Licmophora paradoxa, Strain CCMP2313" /LENGTH=75 /DNA_ID=CAMNT_0049072251 /DNA_START=42 /DNA_END=266 /DNA_ORIENTATION=-